MRDAYFVAALVLGRVAFGYQFQSVAILGPELTSLFRLDYAGLGALIGLYMLPGVFVALPGGLAGRLIGSRIVVGLGIGLMVAGCLIAAAVLTQAGVGFGRVVSGAGAVTLVVMQGKMVSDRFADRRFLPILSLLVGAFPMGIGLAALTREPLVAAFGPRGMFLAGAAVAGVALLLFLPSAGERREVGRSWGVLSWRETQLVTVSGLIWTAYNAGYYGVLSYIPSLMVERGHSPAMIATVMTLSTWCNLPAMVLGGMLAARWGNGRVFLVGSVTAVAAVAGPALLDAPYFWALMFGTIAAVHAGVIVAIGTLSARPENRAIGMGLFYTIYYAGTTFLPALCGQAADWAGSASGALLAAALMTVATIPLFVLHGWLAARPA